MSTAEQPTARDVHGDASSGAPGEESGRDGSGGDWPDLEERPELIVGAAFLGGMVAAWMLRRVRR